MLKPGKWQYHPGLPLRVYFTRQIHSNAQKWSFRVGETPIYQSEFHSSVFGGPSIRVYLAAVRVYLAAVRVYLADRSSVFGGIRQIHSQEFRQIHSQRKAWVAKYWIYWDMEGRFLLKTYWARRLALASGGKILDFRNPKF